MRKNLYFLFAAFVLASMILTACGSASTKAPVAPTSAPQPTSASAEPAPPEDPMAMYMPDAVSGDIVIAGSSTVFPLAERMIERFSEEGFDGNATYDSIGSGAGFERFCVNGETDISGASRAIKDSEIESCKALTPPRNPIEFRVGTDALSVVVSKDNDFVTAVSTVIFFDPDSPFSKFTTLPIQIYQWTSRPQDEFRFLAAAAIIVLLVLLLTLNATAIMLRNRFSPRPDRHPQDRRTDAGTQAKLHHCHRDSQYAAGCPRL